MEFNVFDSIKIGLASPDQIREWSYGEVKKPTSPLSAAFGVRSSISNCRI